MARKKSSRLVLPDNSEVVHRLNLRHVASGRKGGLITAKRYGKEFCEARSSKAGSACLAKYGPGFYRYMRRQALKNQEHRRKLAKQYTKIPKV